MSNTSTIAPLVEPTDTLEDTAPEIRSPQAPQATANLLPGGLNPKTQGGGKAAAAQGEPKRKLIVCIDGTSNQFSEKNTNVVELYSRIKKDKNQLTYYNSGIGTYAKPSWRSYTYMKQVLSNIVDLAIAWNFEKVIIGAYRWLADMYLPGDQIFLFGFSRGAYQVRALAAMIDEVYAIFSYFRTTAYAPLPIRIMHLVANYTINSAWELYSNKDHKVAKFKEAFSRDNVDLHFLGAWDTVSSIGIYPGRLLPKTDECSHITHFRHALALDERRVKFLPEHVWGLKDGGSTKEVWFAGTHSDIGGGNITNQDLNRGGEPLKWMMEEAHHEGLSVKLHDVKVGLPTAEVKESLAGIWQLLEVMPLPRRVRSADGTSKIKWTPHRGKVRKVFPDQKIHWTVRASSDKQNNATRGYQPKAVLLNPNAGPRLSKYVVLDPINLSDQYWEGETSLINAVDLVKQYLQKDEDNTLWFEKLFEYVTTSEMIWTYGGPRLLHSIMKHYPDEKDRTRERGGFYERCALSSSVTRGIFMTDISGLDTKPQDRQTKQREAGEASAEQTTAKPVGDALPLESINLAVIPRIRILLEQWDGTGPKQEAQSEPRPKPSVSLDWLRGLFRSSDATAESGPVKVVWSIQSIEVQSRLVPFVRVLAEIVVDISRLAESAKDAGHIIEDLSRIVHGLLRRDLVTPVAGEQLDLAEVIMNVIAKLSIH
ncbi:hypothetical protein FRC09_000082, partial [Ceratobasidium sp. 395]